MKIKRLSAGTYQTADGRYNIEYGIISEGFCECPPDLCPHPGGEMATYGWWVWDNDNDDYAHDLGECVFDLYRQARHAALSLYARKEGQGGNDQGRDSQVDEADA